MGIVAYVHSNCIAGVHMGKGNRQGECKTHHRIKHQGRDKEKPC